MTTATFIALQKSGVRANPSGKCMCGCGGEAPFATRNFAKKGILKGHHYRYIYGHGKRHAFIAVDPVGLCWVWQGATGHLGYGRYRGTSAHRYFWTKENGPVPAGLTLDHLCRNPRCVNPDHLEAVTQAENVRRAVTTKLDHEAVAEIRRVAAEELAAGRARGENRRRYRWSADLEERYSVSKYTIRSVVNGQSWVST